MKNTWATLQLRVVDGRTGKPTPARFHIRRKDGSPYAPPSTMPQDKFAVPQVILWNDFRKNLHQCMSAERSTTHLSTGEATLPVPAEELTVYVSKGYEREAVAKKIQPRAGKSETLEVKLAPFANLTADGWHSGDMHVHFTRADANDDLMLATLMAGEDLVAVNNMVFKADGEVLSPQRKMGHGGQHNHLAHSHQIIAGGEEFRDDQTYGHMIAAGISSVIEPISTGRTLGRRENYPLFAHVCDWTRQQGGIAGWAHGGAFIKLHESLPIEAALGKLDFIEGVQFNSFIGFYFWYRLLNCGIPLAITGGSDFPYIADILAPWVGNLGLDRTYAYVGKGKEFSYKAYVEAIRKGRCFATNGPLIFLEVDGKEPGARFPLEASKDSVRIKARVAGQYPLESLEIIVNGALAVSKEGKGGPREIALETEIKLDRSAWIAARARGSVGQEVYGGRATWLQHAHTSPVYVFRGHHPIVEKADATWMADYVRYLTHHYNRRGVFKTQKQRAELNANMKGALAYYLGLLRM